jgi:hypothetical protein
MTWVLPLLNHHHFPMSMTPSMTVTGLREWGGGTDLRFRRRQWAMWAIGTHVFFQVVQMQEVRPLLFLLPRLFLQKHCAQNGQWSTDIWPGGSDQNRVRIWNLPGRGHTVGKHQSAYVLVCVCLRVWPTLWQFQTMLLGHAQLPRHFWAFFLRISPARQGTPIGATWQPAVLRAVVTNCVLAATPPLFLTESYSLLPVSFPKLLPCIYLILCEAQVFLHGLLSLAFTSRTNKRTALQWSNDTVSPF